MNQLTNFRISDTHFGSFLVFLHFCHEPDKHTLNLYLKKIQYLKGIVLYLRTHSSLAQLVRASDC